MVMAAEAAEAAGMTTHLHVICMDYKGTHEWEQITHYIICSHSCCKE